MAFTVDMVHTVDMGLRDEGCEGAEGVEGAEEVGGAPKKTRGPLHCYQDCTS